jgi:DNA (cytosine-5)-methyltransferase 1
VVLRPRLLDLFCGQGGAGWGYWLAGFDVFGVDIRPQPRYPADLGFFHGDAMEYVKKHGHQFDVIHASPVCRAHSRAKRTAPEKYQHPDYIPELRELLDATGRPYVIENVEGAPLRSPVTLCGTMFELPMYRHRLFEFGRMAAPAPPPHPPHRSAVAPMGRRPNCGQLWSIAGNFSGVFEASVAMEMPWANQDGLRQAVPPRYTTWVGNAMMAVIQ